MKVDVLQIFGHPGAVYADHVRPKLQQWLERVMNLGKNRIEMRITRSAWFLRDLRFPHS
jgi:hypothetical protein